MKQIQEQNKELERTQEKLKNALIIAEDAKAAAEQDLDLLRKRTQFQLMRRVVGIALGLVISVGLITTALYVTAIALDKDTEVIGNAWTSTLGILLTNSFSIIGTVMGIKYASGEKKED
jgi:predicted DNA repair protein MutK